MLRTRNLLLSILAVVFSISVTWAAESGRIYGRLYTVDDEEFEGWIRWDKNEAFWDDPIDGTCEGKNTKLHKRQKKRRTYKERKRKTISLFGIKIGQETVSSSGWSSSCQLQFGHIRTLQIDGSGAVIELKSGREVEFNSGSDLGGSIRDILVLDINEGEIYFDWDDVDRIEFMEETGKPDDGRQRLYGTVSTRRAGEFTGWIEWDVDEVFTDDIIDGDQNRHRKRKIALGKIAAIERHSSASADIILKEGKELTLRNSNDVNSENRGIIIKSDDFGKVTVEWSDFERVDFEKIPESELPRYDDFDGGRILEGTVTTEDGESFTGHIIWDNDEEFSWEYLNGEFKGLDMDIPFSLISSIEKSSRRGAIVTMKSGDSYLLKGSNDVDEDNRGIFIVLDNNDIEEVDWYDFDKLVLR